MKHMSISPTRDDSEDFGAVPALEHYGSSRPSAYQIALRQLSALQAQAGRLAVAIEAAVGEDNTADPEATVCTEELVRTIQQARLDRIRFFPPQIFSDPAWDMLLELYAAQLAELEVSVAGLCIASNAPATVALECLSTLEQEGLVARRPDPLDERRFSLILTERATRAFTEYFASTPKGAAL